MVSALRSAPARSAGEAARARPVMMGGGLLQTRVVRGMGSWVASEVEQEVTERIWKISKMEVWEARL